MARTTPPVHRERKPWERQPGETPKAFAAFACYRDLGVLRTIDQAYRHWMAKQHRPVPPDKRAAGNFQNWSAKHQWVLRAQAWDEEQDRLKRAAHMRALESMAERHAAMATKVQAIAIKRLNTLTEEDEKGISPTQAVGMMKDAIRIERVSRGEPDGEMNPQTSALPRNIMDALVAASDEQLRNLTRAFRDIVDTAPASYAGDAGGETTIPAPSA